MERRRTGIDAVGDIPWGSHFCHFYQTPQDLTDVLVPYVKAGLEVGEFCMCIVSDYRGEQRLTETLRSAVPETDRHIENGDIEILRYSEWYERDGLLDLDRATQGWREKLDQAVARGYTGLRVNADEAWLTGRDWADFAAYEKRLNERIAGQRVLVACAYPLKKATAGQLFDVARTHQFALARSEGEWEILESPELVQARKELEELNQRLERRVRTRTAALTDANEGLKREIVERKQAELALREMSTRLLNLQDEERRRLARELHDSTAQTLAALNMHLSVLTRSSAKLDARARRELAESRALADQSLREVRTVSYLLYPSHLDEMDLQSALTQYAYGFQQRSGIKIHLDLAPELGEPPTEVEAAVFRVAQEALANVHRHSRSKTASLRLSRGASGITLEVADEGVGIASGAVPGVGISSMRQRVELVGGKLDVESVIGGGARVRAVLPLSPSSA